MNKSQNKKNNLFCCKKILSIFTFVILFLPMWQTCGMQSIPINSEDDGLREESKEIWGVFDCENTISGYKIVWFSINCAKALTEESKENEIIKIEDFCNSFFGAMFLFSTYTLISIILVILSFAKKKRRVFAWLSAINLCVIIISYVCFLDISSTVFMVKFGFYLLIINSLLILCSSFPRRRGLAARATSIKK